MSNTEPEKEYQVKPNNPKAENKEKPKEVTLSKIYSLASCKEKSLLYLSAFLSVINGAATPGLMYLWGDSTDTFSAENTPEETLDELRDYVIIFIIAGCASFVIFIFQVYGFKYVGQTIAERLRKAYFRSILSQEMGWFDKMNPAELSVKAESECNSVIDGIEEKLMTLFFSMSSLIFGIVVGYLRGWQLALIISGIMPFMGISGTLYAKVLSTLGNKKVTVYQKAGAVARQALSAVKTVAALCGEKKEVDRYGESMKSVTVSMIKFGLLQGVTFGSIYFLQYIGYFLSFYFGALFIDDEVENPAYSRFYTAGDALVILFALMIGVFQLSAASPSIKALAISKQAAYRVFTVIERKSEINPFSEEGEKPSTNNGDIRFEDVTFAYPINPDKDVLKKMSVHIEKGKKTAFVGESGSGKSTCVQLLQRFYDPKSGQVTLDGTDIKKLNLKWLRSQISYVGQEPILFSKSIRENLALAKDNVTEDEMISALKQANAYDFVMNLEKKLETFVGNSGTQLSGGQKQRIAIARAIIKNSPILLLDEATSALDRKNEKEIQDTLDKISTERTTIIIAHRLSTVKNADRIYLVGNGEILEAGTHEELIAKEGKYYNLQKAQLLADEQNVEQRQDNNNAGDGKNAELEVKKGEVTSIKKETTTDKKAAKKEKEKEDKQAIGKLFGYAKPERGLLILSSIVAALNGAIPPISTLFYTELLEILLNPADPEFFDKASTMSYYFFAIGGASLIFYSLQVWMFNLQSEKLIKRMRMELLDKFLRKEMAWHDQEENNTSVLSSVLQTNCNDVGQLTSTIVGIMCQSASLMIVALIISFVASWELTLLGIGSFPFLIFAGIVTSSVVESTTTLPELQKASQVIQEVIGNMKTVATFGREEIFLREYEAVLPIVRKKIQKKGLMIGFSMGLSNLFMFLIFAMIFYVGAVIRNERGLGVADMFKGMLVLTFAAFDMGAAMQLMPDVGKATGSAKTIFKYLEMKSEIDIDDEKLTYKEPIKGNFEFKNVTFKYPTRNKKVFKNFNFKSQAGQQIGLVGSSGCGKSTIMQLLLRFYDVQEGEILIDGKNIKEFNLHHLRSQMSIVSQEPPLFNESIRDNIKYSKPSASEEEMKEAARVAEALNFIEKSQFGDSDKPSDATNNVDTQGKGFDRVVGPGGNQLSGGQKQRVAIARAVIRKPNVLLLDEATSALDSQTEGNVQNNLNKLMKEKTSLVIAHRFATIKECDEIHVFKEGDIVEKGTYKDLTEKQGYFYQLERGLN